MTEELARYELDLKDSEAEYEHWIAMPLRELLLHVLSQIIYISQINFKNAFHIP